MKDMVVYVDEDDTFVRSFGTKRISIQSTIEHIRQLHAAGARLFCWSAGGDDYARRSAVEFGIDTCFEGFLSKPNVMIDDQAPTQWPRCQQVHPVELSSWMSLLLEKTTLHR